MITYSIKNCWNVNLIRDEVFGEFCDKTKSAPKSAPKSVIKIAEN